MKKLISKGHILLSANFCIKNYSITPLNIILKMKNN